MLKIIKKTGTALSAWRLGDPEPVLEQLIARGRIRRRGQVWEVFSREAAAGSTGHGQEAQTGDYIKLDSGGWPYPNGAAWFLANHRHIEGDRYEQLPHPLDAWTADEPLCPEVEFLIREKGLLLRPEEPRRYFSAPLWGTLETAARDAVLVFYSVSRREDGTITDAAFNFVQREEFNRSYTILNH